VGAITTTTQGIGYQIGLHEATLQQAAGGQLSLLIDSQSADELVIQSRDWPCFPPKLIVYYSTEVAAASTETLTGTDVDGPAAEGLSMIEGAAINSQAERIEDLSSWFSADPYAGFPYMLENTLEKCADTDFKSYMPFLVQ
jgi:hypothetical protein